MSHLLCLSLKEVISRATSVVLFSFVSFFEIQEYPEKRLRGKSMKMQKKKKKGFIFLSLVG